MNINAEVTGKDEKNTGKEEKEIWEKTRCKTCGSSGGICSSTVRYIELNSMLSLLGILLLLYERLLEFLAK